MRVKICVVCYTQKQMYEFYQQETSKDGFSKMCKPCYFTKVNRDRRIKFAEAVMRDAEAAQAIADGTVTRHPLIDIDDSKLDEWIGFTVARPEDFVFDRSGWARFRPVVIAVIDSRFCLIHYPTNRIWFTSSRWSTHLMHHKSFTYLTHNIVNRT